MTKTRIRTGISVINEHNQILLVPHYVDREIYWYLPGGKIEFLERIEDAAVREFQEETGFEVEITSEAKIIEFIRQNPPWHSITFVYSGKIIGGKLQGEDSPWGVKMPVWYGKQDLSQIEIVSYLRDIVIEQID